MLVEIAALLLMALSGSVSGAVLMTARRRMMGTTLMAPWYWSVAAMVLLLASEGAIATMGGIPLPAWAVHLRYLTSIVSLAPLMSLLGAKRPQDSAWQFIVLSLLVILALPAAQSLVIRPEATFHPHVAWSWFLLVLILIGPTNYLLTRYWPCGLMFAAAQLCLLGDWLPAPLPLPQSRGLLGLGLTAAALLLAARRADRPTNAATQWDRLWLDFRDAYGAVWGLRVAERINAAARQYGWPVWLGWYGLVATDRPGQAPSDADLGQPAHPPAELAEALLHSYRTLLRRFVSRDWIATRADRP